jgi:putative MATE family efflux protein
MPSDPQPLTLDVGNLNRRIVRLAGPAVLENLLNTALFVINTLFVGWLREPAALAAIGVGNTLQVIGQNLFMALGVAALALVARAWGAGDHEGARRLTAHAIVVTLLLSLALAIALFVLAEPLFRLLVRDNDARQLETVIASGAEYTRILMLVAPLAYGRVVISATMRAAGDTRTPMLITLLVNGLNIALAAVLIFGVAAMPGMGVRGAAIAAAVAQSVGGLAAFAVLFSGRHRLRLRWGGLSGRPFVDRMEILRILRVAAPNLAEAVVLRIGFILFTGIVGGLGAAAIAAHQIANAIESVSYMPGQGLATATAALVGQSLGARKPEIAALVVRRAGLFGVGIMLLMGACYALFGRQLAALYGAQGDVLMLAAQAVRISALELPTLALYNIYSGALRGAGDTRSPMLVSLIGVIFFRVAVVWLLTVQLGLGLAGVWLGTAIDWAGRAIVVYLLFRGGRWLTARP